MHTLRFSGSILLISVMTNALLLASITTMYTYFGTLQLHTTRQFRQLQAATLADSGINRAIARYRLANTYTGETVTLTTGQVVITVSNTPAGYPQGHKLIIAQAYVPSQSAPNRICREVRFQVNNPGNHVAGTYEVIPCR